MYKLGTAGLVLDLSGVELGESIKIRSFHDTLQMILQSGSEDYQIDRDIDILYGQIKQEGQTHEGRQPVALKTHSVENQDLNVIYMSMWCF